MTPKHKSAVVRQALEDAARHGKPGDVDRILKYLKENPGAVEELAKEQDNRGQDSDDRTSVSS